MNVFLLKWKFWENYCAAKMTPMLERIASASFYLFQDCEWAVRLWNISKAKLKKQIRYTVVNCMALDRYVSDNGRKGAISPNN